MEKFLMQVSKLEPIEFIGLANLFGADLLEEDKKTPRDFADILRDVISKYETLERKKKREVDRLLKTINSERGARDAS